MNTKINYKFNDGSQIENRSVVLKGTVSEKEKTSLLNAAGLTDYQEGAAPRHQIISIEDTKQESLHQTTAQEFLSRII